MTMLFSAIFNLEQTSYWLLLGWLFGMGILMNIMPKKTEILNGRLEKRWYWFSAILLVLPYVLWAAYRPFTGDTGAYSRRFLVAPSRFEDIPNYMLTRKKDRGFELLIAVLKCLGVPNYQTMFLIFAAFQMWCMVYTFRRYSPNFWISFFLFIVSTDYISWMFNGIRQFTAVCMSFAALRLLVERKYVRFSMVILLAYTIHASVLVMIPLAFIMQGSALNRKTLMTIVFAVLCIPFIDRFTPLLEQMLSDTQYGDVMSNEIWTTDDGTNLFRVMVYSVPAIITILGYPYVVGSKDPVMNLCMNASVVTASVYLISSVTSGVYVGRLPIYTTLHGYIVLPWVVDQVFEKQTAKLMKVLMICCYLAFFYYQMHIAWGTL